MGGGRSEGYVVIRGAKVLRFTLVIIMGGAQVKFCPLRLPIYIFYFFLKIEKENSFVILFKYRKK